MTNIERPSHYYRRSSAQNIDDLFLMVCVGLPACGKSTHARDVRERESKEVALVSKDELRPMLHDGWSQRKERITEEAEQALVERLLFDGVNVVVHDTNLYRGHLVTWKQIAEKYAADLIIASFLHVPVKECIRRDADRTGTAQVGSTVIMRLYRQHLEGDRQSALEAWIQETTDNAVQGLRD